MSSVSPDSKKLTTWQSLLAAMKSPRTASVALLSFASGMPLGLVWIAIPDWLRSTGADIRVVGLVSLAQAPWTFKIFWSPLMDRYSPPFWGRRRGWVGLAQIALLIFTLALAGVAHRPETPWVVMALALCIAFSAATQDIAYDAYAVEVLLPEEQGIAVGARQAIYRVGMSMAGGVAITLAGHWSWQVVNVILALLYLPMLWITSRAPEPEEKTVVPKTLREAFWHPFVEFLSRRKALSILGFVIFYKLADNLATALIRPFLIDMGYSNDDRGVGLLTVGLPAMMLGGIVGGMATNGIGLGPALWLFGFLQMFATLGYVMVAQADGVHRLLMYSAIGFESLAVGLGTGAFGVLLLRLAKRRYAATQTAFFTVLFAFPRILAGPVTGYLVNSFGCDTKRCYPESWAKFFWLTIPAGIPGLLLLQRFSPLGSKEPLISVEDEPAAREPLSKSQLVMRGIVGGLTGFFIALAVGAFTAGWKSRMGGPATSFVDNVTALIQPIDLSGRIRLFAIVAFALGAGFFVAAFSAARHRK